MVRKYFYGTVLCLLLVSSLLAAEENKPSHKNQNKRDPFMPLISPAGYLLNLEPEKDAALRLEGIMYDAKGDSMAIINGELIRVGETIADVVVTAIEPNKVVMIKDNQKLELELREGE